MKIHQLKRRIRTHARMHARTHAHPHSRDHHCTHTPHAHMYMFIHHAHEQTRENKHSCTRTRTRAHTHTHTYTLIDKDMGKLIYPHTDRHSHIYQYVMHYLHAGTIDAHMHRYSMTHIRLCVKRPFVKYQHTLGMRISFSPSFRYTRSNAGGLVRQCSLLLLIVCLTVQPAWARIHESVITYDGHISRPDITELELGPSENSYSRARKTKGQS